MATVKQASMTKLTDAQDQKLRQVIADFRHFKGMIESLEEVTDEKKFKDDFGADSLDVVELVMELEKEFDCQIADDLGDRVVTVADAKEVLELSIKP